MFYITDPLVLQSKRDLEKKMRQKNYENFDAEEKEIHNIKEICIEILYTLADCCIEENLIPKTRSLQDNLYSLYPLDLLDKIRGFCILITKGFRSLHKSKKEAVMIEDYEFLVKEKEEKILDLKKANTSLKQALRRMNIELKAKYSENDVMDRFKAIDSAYKSKTDKLIAEIKRRDSQIDVWTKKNVVTQKQTSEIQEKMVRVTLAERKMEEVEDKYVKDIRKIFSHYCISLSNVVIEANKIKKLYQRLTNVKITNNKIQVILRLSLKKFQEIVLTFEKFMGKYDRGKDLKEIINSYYHCKNKLVEAINNKIYYNSFQKFEKMLNDETNNYKRLGRLDDDLLPLPKSQSATNKVFFKSASLSKDNYLSINHANSDDISVINQSKSKQLRRIGTVENMKNYNSGKFRKQFNVGKRSRFGKRKRSVLITDREEDAPSKKGKKKQYLFS